MEDESGEEKAKCGKSLLVGAVVNSIFVSF